MIAEIAEEPIAYEITVKGYLDWRFWSDCFGVKVSEEPGGEVVLRGTVSDRAALRRLIVRLRFEGARIRRPITAAPIESVR
jgi:hypothetical protein